MTLFIVLSAIAIFAPAASEWVALGIILIAGIPHGAFDLRLASARWEPRIRPRGVILGYVLTGVGMSLLCLLSPGLGLTAFLGLSLVHFAESESVRSSALCGAVIASAAVFVPILLNSEQAFAYLGSFIVLPKASSTIWTNAGFAVWSLAVGATVVGARRGARADTLQRAVSLAAWVLLSPLAGFAVWFVGRHSWQHFLECRARFRSETGALPQDFFATAGLALLLLLPLFLKFDPRRLEDLVSASIVLIAGLTLPHVVVTSKWARPLCE
jgi:Brp/Blh family beta-carotene 15,15'-monooxygenase